MGESTFVAGMWFLYGIYKLLGRGPFLVCLYPVVFYYWASRRAARQASMDYLRQMHAQHGVPAWVPTWRDGLRHFLSFADTLLDKTLATSGSYRFDRIRYEGLEPMLERVRSGAGGVFITAHMGCLELCQALAGQCDGLRIHVLVHTRHAERFNRMLHRLNPHSGVHLMQVTEISPATAVMLAEKVGRGEFVAIAGDRVPVNMGPQSCVEVSFLGRPAALPIGPYVLASLLKCPLYLLACIREGRHHTLVFERLADQVHLPRGARLQAATVLAQGYVQRLEALLIRAPFEWFNFFAFWAQRTAPEAAPNSLAS
ncbi:MAG: acyltransferase [Ideonella sp. MAG2]|nr:MAG: acyltransferase [Ideonella sp. MAG2]